MGAKRGSQAVRRPEKYRAFICLLQALRSQFSEIIVVRNVPRMYRADWAVEEKRFCLPSRQWATTEVLLNSRATNRRMKPSFTYLAPLCMKQGMAGGLIVRLVADADGQRMCCPFHQFGLANAISTRLHVVNAWVLKQIWPSLQIRQQCW